MHWCNVCLTFSTMSESLKKGFDTCLLNKSSEIKYSSGIDDCNHFWGIRRSIENIIGSKQIDMFELFFYKLQYIYKSYNSIVTSQHFLINTIFITKMDYHKKHSFSNR